MEQAVLSDKTHKVDQENFLPQDNSQADKALTLVVDLEEGHQVDLEAMFQTEDHPQV